MKNRIKLHLTSLIIIAFLVLAGCTDSAKQETSTAPAQESEVAPDKTIQTSSYIFSIFEDPQGDLFSIRKLDQTLVASNISKEELISSYPEAFDELILDGLSENLDNKIYYDDVNRNRIRMPD